MLLNGEPISEAQAKKEFELRLNAMSSEQYIELAEYFYSTRNKATPIEVLMTMLDKDRRTVIPMIGYLKKKGFEMVNTTPKGSGKSPKYRMVGFKEDAIKFIKPKNTVDRPPLNPVMHPLIEQVFRP